MECLSMAHKIITNRFEGNSLKLVLCQRIIYLTQKDYKSHQRDQKFLNWIQHFKNFRQITVSTQHAGMDAQ